MLKCHKQCKNKYTSRNRNGLKSHFVMGLHNLRIPGSLNSIIIIIIIITIIIFDSYCDNYNQCYFSVNMFLRRKMQRLIYESYYFFFVFLIFSPANGRTPTSWAILTTTSFHEDFLPKFLKCYFFTIPYF